MATSDTSGRSTLPEQVDPDQHVVHALAQLAQQLHPAQRVDLGVQVAHPDAVLEQVVGEVLGHLLGQRGDQHPLVPIGPQLDLVHQIVDLALGGLDHDLGIDQPGRPDHLLDELALGLLQLPGAGGRGEIDHLADPLQELVEAQRPVVGGAGQPEAVVDEHPLAGRVALVHAADLRDGHVRLVDHGEEVVGEVVEQAVRRAARQPPVHVHRVVLDAGAEPDLAHHLESWCAHPHAVRSLPCRSSLWRPLGQLHLMRVARSICCGPAA
jgi:hypothetical protein